MCITMSDIKQIAEKIKRRSDLGREYKAIDIVEDAEKVGEFLAENGCSSPYLMAFWENINRAERTCASEMARFFDEERGEFAYQERLIFLQPRLKYRYTKAKESEKKAFEALEIIYSALLGKLSETYRPEDKNSWDKMRQDIYKFKEFFQGIAAYFNALKK